MRRFVWIMLVTVALVAAACGGDDSSSDGAATEDPVDEADDSAGETSDDDSASDDDEVDDDGGDGDEPVELTASWTGVTEDTIRIGIAGIDFAAVSEFGVDIEGIDPNRAYPAYAAAFNEAGGAHGRDVEVIVELFLPVGAVDSDRACTVLTEDEEVFLTIGQMLGDNPLCFTEIHDTPYVGVYGLTTERDERSDGQFYAYQMQVERQRHDAVVALHDSGAFDGHKVGLFWEIADRPVVDDVIKPLLDDLGVDVVSEGQLEDFADDTSAASVAADLIFLRFEADGADLLLNASGLVAFNRAVERNSYEGQLVFLNGQMGNASIVGTSGYDPDILVGAVGSAGAGAELDEMLADPLWHECVELLNASGEFEEPFVVEELDKATAGGIRSSCGTWKLVEAMLLAAGPELTPDSLREGAEGLGTFDLPGAHSATLGPDDHSAADAVRLFAYDPDEVVFVPAGDPIVVG